MPYQNHDPSLTSATECPLGAILLAHNADDTGVSVAPEPAFGAADQRERICAVQVATAHAEVPIWRAWEALTR
jgi:hypothetical protein